MLTLSRQTQGKLIQAVERGEEIPQVFLSLLGAMHLGPLLDIAVKNNNLRFIRQLRFALEAVRLTKPERGGRIGKAKKLLKHNRPPRARKRGKVHRVWLSPEEKYAIAQRVHQARWKRINRTARGRKLYAHFVQGGAPGLVQQR